MEPFPGGGTDGPATLGSDTVAINAMIALTKTRTNNASTRFFIYEAWPLVKYGDLNSYSTAWRIARCSHRQTPNMISPVAGGHV